MTRKKVKLAFIQNDTERKVSYKKRKKGLMKKVEEISTLCGIDACAILYGPYDDEPEIWPPSPYAVQNLLSRFKMLPGRFKRMMNQEGFTRQRVDKMHNQIRRQEKGNQEKELTRVIFRCLAGEDIENFREVVDFNDMNLLISRYMKEIARKIALLKNHMPQMAPAEVPLETIGNGGNNESTVASEMPVNEMQHFTWSDTNRSMVAPETPVNEMQHFSWSATNSSMVTPEMPSNEMQNLTWPPTNASMVAPEMQNVTWSTNNGSIVVPEMPMNEMQNPTWSSNNASMVAPEIPMNEMQNLAWSANNDSMVAPEMPTKELQSLTWDMDMLTVNEQPWLSGFMWDDPFFQSIISNDGAGPSNSVP